MAVPERPDETMKNGLRAHGVALTAMTTASRPMPSLRQGAIESAARFLQPGGLEGKVEFLAPLWQARPSAGSPT